MAAISVIVPVYRVEPYLHRCVDSILNQTLLDFDLILVDDGSPDSCGSICDDYARRDDRVHVIHQENGGLSAARNAGIDWAVTHSDSGWITFVDSDDWIHGRMLEYLLNMAEAYGVNVSICGYADTQGDEPSVSMEQDASSLWSPEDFYIAWNMRSAIAWGKLYRKSLFSRIRYPLGRLYEDEYTTYRLLFPEKYVAVSDIPLYFYYQNEAGISKLQWSPRGLDAVQAIGEQIGYFKKHGFQRAYATAALWYTELIRFHRRQVEEASLPPAEKERLRKLLDRRLQEAGWRYPDIYLRHDPYFYLDVFPRIIRLYRRLRGKEKEIRPETKEAPWFKPKDQQ